MRKWLISILLVSLLLLLASGVSVVGMASEPEEFPITEEQPFAAMNCANQDMRLAMREAPCNVPKMLETPIDWFAEFLSKLLESGNAFITFWEIDEAYPGVEATFWESPDSHVQVAIGYILEKEQMIYQIKTDRIPLLAEWSEIFERFEPGIGLVGGEQARFLLTLRYDWKNEG